MWPSTTSGRASSTWRAARWTVRWCRSRPPPPWWRRAITATSWRRRSTTSRTPVSTHLVRLSRPGGGQGQDPGGDRFRDHRAVADRGLRHRLSRRPHRQNTCSSRWRTCRWTWRSRRSSAIATPAVSKSTLAVAISQSGETADTLAALKWCKAKGLKTAALVNAHQSTMAREADVMLPANAGVEVGVASTKAFTRPGLRSLGPGDRRRQRAGDHRRQGRGPPGGRADGGAPP